MTYRQLEVARQVAGMSELPLDRLPYTEEFERLWREFIRRFGEPYPKADVYQLLLSVRKRGLLGPNSRFPRRNGGN